MELGKIAEYADKLKELSDRLEKAKPKKQSHIEEYKEKLVDTTDMLHEMRIDSDEDDQC
jgi:hypothetical protein